MKLGSYEILSRIGAGGMGEVWRAKDSKIGRDIAIKVLPASLVTDTDRLQRFEQEARAAGTLNHPNLVTIYELGTHDGAPFIAMELLEGETLRDEAYAGKKEDGIPHPAVFVLDAKGRVRWMKIESDFRERPTNAEIAAAIDAVE